MRVRLEVFILRSRGFRTKVRALDRLGLKATEKFSVNP